MAEKRVLIPSVVIQKELFSGDTFGGSWAIYFGKEDFPRAEHIQAKQQSTVRVVSQNFFAEETYLSQRNGNGSNLTQQRFKAWEIFLLLRPKNFSIQPIALVPQKQAQKIFVTIAAREHAWHLKRTNSLSESGVLYWRALYSGLGIIWPE